MVGIKMLTAPFRIRRLRSSIVCNGQMGLAKESDNQLTSCSAAQGDLARHIVEGVIKEEYETQVGRTEAPYCPKSRRRDGGVGEAATRPVAVIRRTTRI